VLEGFVYPGNVKPEGPFGEWMGYYGTEVREEPVMDVKAIYHRNDPIILGCPPLRPPDEIARLKAIIRSGMLRENLTRAGVPEVTATLAHEVGTSRLLLGVAIKQRYAGHATQAGHIACQCHVGAYAGRYVIVVDDDIDVSNLEELIWAMLTRSDPASSIDIVHNAWSTGLDVRIDPERRAKDDFTNSRAIINACRPWHWRDKFPKVTSSSPDALRMERAKCGQLLSSLPERVHGQPRRKLLSGIIAGLLLASSAGHAQEAYPTRPVQLVVTFPAGGSADFVARLLAERMSRTLKQQ